MAIELNCDNRTVFTSDNLPVLRGLNAGCVDLIYLDPPFGSCRDYAGKADSVGESFSFSDRWGKHPVSARSLDRIEKHCPKLANLLEIVPEMHSRPHQNYLAYMGVRLLEMHRVLHDRGSLYLHCDATASHYLKVVLDCIFGRNNFREEIVWNRQTGRVCSRRWGRVCDVILFYSKTSRYRFRPVLTDHHGKEYEQADDRGEWNAGQLHGPRLYGSPAEKVGSQHHAHWRGYSPFADGGRFWCVPSRDRYAQWIEANVIPGFCSMKSVLARLDALDEADMIVWQDLRNGIKRPMLKRYRMAYFDKRQLNCLFPTVALGSDFYGFPTQKPKQILRWIVEASSLPGNVVLDPFAGSGTTLVAAEELGRRWVGVDKEDFTELLGERLKDCESMFSADLEVIHRLEAPVKTVRDDGLPKGSRRVSAPVRRKRGRPRKVRLELAGAGKSSARNGSSAGHGLVAEAGRE